MGFRYLFYKYSHPIDFPAASTSGEEGYIRSQKQETSVDRDKKYEFDGFEDLWRVIIAQENVYPGIMLSNNAL
ncbi:hypothetical protein AYI69_g130 [Smittium culicis]|uniref:Uncharacterized protein n=1 Tax=Smittium culicis TaxID=133412 RepID=A0A1R1YTW5_9FUNG|nr:hypothetical protein AYI69_g130 [Smittium culicis]